LILLVKPCAAIKVVGTPEFDLGSTRDGLLGQLSLLRVSGLFGHPTPRGRGPLPRVGGQRTKGGDGLGWPTADRRGGQLGDGSRKNDRGEDKGGRQQKGPFPTGGPLLNKKAAQGSREKPGGLKSTFIVSGPQFGSDVRMSGGNRQPPCIAKPKHGFSPLCILREYLNLKFQRAGGGPHRLGKGLIQPGFGGYCRRLPAIRKN